MYIHIYVHIIYVYKYDLLCTIWEFPKIRGPHYGNRNQPNYGNSNLETQAEACLVASGRLCFGARDIPSWAN